MFHFSEQLRKRVRSKLGEPVMVVELEDEQMSDLYSSAIKNWYLYSSLSKLNIEILKDISEAWVENYFQSLCKEALGRIRGKYKGNLPIPGSEISLEHDSLSRESEQEKNSLVSLLVPSENKIMLAVYIDVGHMDYDDVEKYMKKISKQLSSDKSYKLFAIPVKNQETRIECIYPNFLYDEEMKSKMNTVLDKLIENIKPNE